MHHCFSVDEILRLLACTLVASEAKATAVALACSCRSFEDPVLDALWKTQDQLFPLLKSLPGDVWKVEAGRFVSLLAMFGLVSLRLIALLGKSFNRIPTKAEWSRFRKYARSMRELRVNTLQNPVTPDVLSALHLRTGNEPLLPRLKTFVCEGTAEEFIPAIPLFLSSTTNHIGIKFDVDSPTLQVASTIARLSTLCPDLEHIFLDTLPKGQVITNAASEMLLACNRDTLQEFFVSSPLTEEARVVLYQLPKLRQLWSVIKGPISLPPVALPSLITLSLRYDQGHQWLRGLVGATLGRLKRVAFYCNSASTPTTDFLDEFKRVALSTSSQDTLLSLAFRTSQSWNPNYSSLLVFKQLTELSIEFSCQDGCSSRVDDDLIASLTEAMPKLETLQLGRPPCQAATGITLKGLVTLARHCPQLSELCVHFQALDLAETATSTEPPPPPEHTAVVPPTNCVLTHLQVGDAPIPPGEFLAVSVTLLQVFPQIHNIKYTNPQWKHVADTINLFKRFDGHIFHTSKPHLSRL